MTSVRTVAEAPSGEWPDDEANGPVMTRVHLDTSFLIKALAPGTAEDAQLRKWLRAGADISISVVAWAEFLCRPVSEDERKLARRIVGTPTHTTDDDAVRAADLFNAAGGRGGSLPDCLIAASALNADASLATSSPRDFHRFEKAGLALAAD